MKSETEVRKTRDLLFKSAMALENMGSDIPNKNDALKTCLVSIDTLRWVLEEENSLEKTVNGLERAITALESIMTKHYE